MVHIMATKNEETPALTGEYLEMLAGFSYSDTNSYLVLLQGEDLPKVWKTRRDSALISFPGKGVK